MPSTYSPDLRIELIANGEQSGTWGTTTNTNLGTLIEDAISGAASVSVVSGNQAFTVANGAVDEARCAAIILTTTTGANFNVYAPSVTKLYVIRNNSAHQATIFCNAGTVLSPVQAGAGYSIPAGRTVFIRSSNESGSWEFRNCIDSFGTTGLPVQSGGTGLISFPALSAPVANTLNTLTALPVAANQSIRVNSSGTAWEAYPVATGGIIQVTGAPPITSTGGNTPVIGLAANYGDTQNPYASKAANLILASPNGSAGVPSFRALVAADLPNTAVTPGSYTSANITVDAQGRIIAAANGGGGGGGVSSVTGSGAINASPTTGAVQLTVATADGSTPGIVSATTQAFNGVKTFNNGLQSTTFNFSGSSSIYLTSSKINIDINSVTYFSFNNVNGNYSHAQLAPSSDNSYALGNVSQRWSAVWAVNGTIQTSDAREKIDVADSVYGLDFIKALRPVSYKWVKSGNPDANGVDRPGVRTHYGFIAQEVKELIGDGNNFGGYVKGDLTDSSSLEGLRYHEFIAPMVKAIQELSAQVETLKAKVAALEGA